VITSPIGLASAPTANGMSVEWNLTLGDRPVYAPGRSCGLFLDPLVPADEALARVLATFFMATAQPSTTTQ